MRSRKAFLPFALGATIVVAGCATTPSGNSVVSAPPADEESHTIAAHAVAPTAAYAPKRATSDAASLNIYKQHAAKRIAAVTPERQADSLPPILKSVVVLDISVDRDGNPVHVAVRRSNGYKDFERAAVESVKRAGPLPAPSPAVLGGHTMVSYTETWLFRPDGRYQIRSIAEEQDLSGGIATAAKKR
jgi:TonB family protein